MTDEQDNQSSSQDAQDASQETSNQGTSISFDVQGDVPAIAQPKSMACWATVTTMNMSWKNQQSYSIESAIDSIGSDFRQIFDDNTGRSPTALWYVQNAERLASREPLNAVPCISRNRATTFGPSA